MAQTSKAIAASTEQKDFHLQYDLPRCVLPMRFSTHAPFTEV